MVGEDKIGYYLNGSHIEIPEKCITLGLDHNLIDIPKI